MLLAVRAAHLGDVANLDVLKGAAMGIARAHRGGPELLEDLAAALDGSVESYDALLLGTGGWRCLVATIDGIVVGALLLADAGVIRTVWACFVEEDARGIGCGEALFHEALQAWPNARLERFEVLALPGDRAMKSAGERMGAKARLLRLSRPMDGEHLLRNDGLAN